jgi:hypothetical protein
MKQYTMLLMGKMFFPPSKPLWLVLFKKRHTSTHGMGSMLWPKKILVHTNLCGMIHLASLGGARYFISFTNDFSCFTWLYFLKQKFEALQAFKTFCANIEFQFTPLKLFLLHNDCGGKYLSRDFLTFCTEASITHEPIQSLHTKS